MKFWLLAGELIVITTIAILFMWLPQLRRTRQTAGISGGAASFLVRAYAVMGLQAYGKTEKYWGRLFQCCRPIHNWLLRSRLELPEHVRLRNGRTDLMHPYCRKAM